ncbi:MAG: hypothetical protein AAF611_12965 [Bacteroidota bacterium]
MSIKNYLFSLIICTLFVTSCAPSFDLENEQANIEKAILSGFDLDKKINIFYPNARKRDSVKKIVKQQQQILHEIQRLFKNRSIDINSVSATVELQERLFKVINVTQQFSILKEEFPEIPYSVIKDYLKSNLFEYTESPSKFDVKGDTDILAIHYKDSWEYFNFSASLLYDAYGLTDAKKIIQLYYDEIFEPTKEKWDAETIQIFKEEYQKIKDQPQYQKLDFDAYCDCMISFQEKIDAEVLYESNYYDNDTYLNHLSICRILTARE